MFIDTLKFIKLVDSLLTNTGITKPQFDNLMDIIKDFDPEDTYLLFLDIVKMNSDKRMMYDSQQFSLEAYYCQGYSMPEPNPLLKKGFPDDKY